MLHAVKALLLTVRILLAPQVSSGGQLDMHGKEHTPTWTRLSSTAIPGDAVISLQQPVNWESGQLVVVATGVWRDEFSNQNEVGVCFLTALQEEHSLSLKHCSLIANFLWSPPMITDLLISSFLFLHAGDEDQLGVLRWAPPHLHLQPAVPSLRVSQTVTSYASLFALLLSFFLLFTFIQPFSSGALNTRVKWP